MPNKLNFKHTQTLSHFIMQYQNNRDKDTKSFSDTDMKTKAPTTNEESESPDISEC